MMDIPPVQGGGEDPHYIKLHIEAFGIEPIIIGMFWDDQDRTERNVMRAIKAGKPYDELSMLEKEDRKSYNSGGLFF